MKKKAILLLTISIFGGGWVLAQPSQEMPHRVFGTVEDTQNSVVTSTEVEVVFEGETLASDSTDEDGYYDISVSYGDDFAGEEVQIEVSGRQSESFTYSSGKTENLDLNVDNPQEQGSNDQESSSGGGGGGGLGDLGDGESDSTNSSNQSASEPDDDGRENVSQTGSSLEESVKDNDEEGSNDEVSEDGEVDNYKDFGDTESAVEEVEIKAGGASRDVSVEEVDLEAERKDDEERPPQVSDKDEVYQYLEIDSETEVKNATVEFKVNKSFVNKHGASPEEVSYRRYNGQRWNKLDTQLVSEESEHYLFESVSPDGFSYFAITIDEEEQVNSLTGMFASSSPSNPLILLVLAVAAVLAAVVYRRDSKSRNMTGLEEYR